MYRDAYSRIYVGISMKHFLFLLYNVKFTVMNKILATISLINCDANSVKFYIAVLSTI
jgi:hypothetical protein